MLQDFLINSSSSDICLQKYTKVQLHLLTFLPMMFPDHGALWKLNAGFCAARAYQLCRASSKLMVLGFRTKCRKNFDSSEIDNSTPLSNYPVPLPRGPSQSLLALLKIQERFHPCYAVGVAHFLFPLFCDSLLIVMQAHHQHFTAEQFPHSSEIGPSAPVFASLSIIPLGGNTFVVTFPPSRLLALQTFAHRTLRTAYLS